MKYSHWIGLAFAVLLVIACFMPWAYYPDIDKVFTGFFSEQNRYGKPGKVLIFFSVIATILFFIPRIWAKRFNMLITALNFAFAIKSFLLFSSCYRGICPEKKTGIFLIVISAVIMLVVSLLPDMKLKENNN
ncbi:MAG: hypothetical protein JST96_19100 [Bacteroidetes bacterium]|nr:hypothetical protein [Bacteroidota bacterium]